jgi:hypothetical protein
LRKAAGTNRRIDVASAKHKSEDLIWSRTSCILRKTTSCDSFIGKKGEKIIKVGTIGAVWRVIASGATCYIERIEGICQTKAEENYEKESR